MQTLASLLPGTRQKHQAQEARLARKLQSARRFEYELTLDSDQDLIERSLELRATSWSNRAGIIKASERANEESGSAPDLNPEHLISATALGSEAIRRSLGFRLHDVQVQGAIATALGSIIEMQTGEGKTVVCGLAAYIRSIFDTSVHVATTNDYLAERDHQSVSEAFRKTRHDIRRDPTGNVRRADSGSLSMQHHLWSPVTCLDLTI